MTTPLPGPRPLAGPGSRSPARRRGAPRPADEAAAPLPVALAVGSVAVDPAVLAAFVELRRASVVEARDALARGGVCLLLLDHGEAAAVLSGLRPALPAPGQPGRPAVLIVSPDGVRGPHAGLLEGPADDVVAGGVGPEELVARVRGALRVRGFVSELSEKNRALEAVSRRLEEMAGRMAAELALASKVQRSLMPLPISHPRLEMAREFIPFREIGGDFYDVIALGPDRLAFAIGDVMGKGVPAALLAASLKACLRAQLLAGVEPIDEVLVRVNQLFCEVTPTNLFASLFFAVFDLAARRVEYVNAGHHYPLVVHPDGSVAELDQGGTVLGLIDDARYARGDAALGRDDVMVFYSDGVTDRANSAGELYGEERLKEAAGRVRHDGARIALYTLLGDIQGWSTGCPPTDDLTLVVARVL